MEQHIYGIYKTFYGVTEISWKIKAVLNQRLDATGITILYLEIYTES